MDDRGVRSSIRRIWRPGSSDHRPKLGCRCLRDIELPPEGAEIAKYHFHLHDGAFVPDRDGVELPNWEAAVDHALARATAAVTERGAPFWKGEHMRLVVTDRIGTGLFELRLSGHLPLEPTEDSPHDPPPLN